MLPDLKIDTKSFLIILGLLIAAAIFSKIFRWLLDKSFNKASEKLKVDPTRYKFFKNTLTLLIFLSATVVIIYMIPSLRTLAISLFAGAGILVAILGLAAQQAFSNIISGLFLVMFKPFRVGDLVTIGQNYRGVVNDITLRHTVITDFENRRIIIPNAVVSAETIVNSSIDDSKICKFVEFGISYDSDVDLALKIMREEAQNHPLFLDNRSAEEKAKKEPAVRTRVIGFGDSSVNLRAWVWTRNPEDAFFIHWDLNKSVKARFDKEGIEIPFPYRTLVFKDSEDKKKVTNGKSG